MEVEELDKLYYKIGEVAEIIGVPQSTLRFWEKEFDGVAPIRTPSGVRLYTPENIERLRIIHFLIKTRGLKIKSAKEQLAANKGNLSRRLLTIDRLEDVKDQLKELLKALQVRK